VYDGSNLLYHADLVISGGGTMNREAAVLGTPTYTVFKGKLGAVDEYLIQRGRMIHVRNQQDMQRMLTTHPRQPTLLDKAMVVELTRLILNV
jgi:predicted glycosyltransferase